MQTKKIWGKMFSQLFHNFGIQLGVEKEEKESKNNLI